MRTLMTTPKRSSGEYVCLRHGPTLPLDVLRVAWSLEDRGLSLQRTSTGKLLVGPREALTDDDRQQFRRWRDHLLALVDYASADQLVQ